jgi:hypothetical protein
MPKASFASKDAYEVKLGIQEGHVEIVDAKTAVYQFPPNKETGDQGAPFLAALITFQLTDANGKHLEDEPSDKVLKIEKDLHKMRPGMASSRDDANPTDQGAELETVGNCIYTEDAKINNKCGWQVFCKSMEECGFRVDILGAGYLPDLVGTKGHVKTLKGEKTKIDGKEIEPSYLVWDSITARPYEAGQTAAKKPAGKATTTAASAGKPNGVATSASPSVTPPPAPAAANGAPASEAVDEAATNILLELAGELDGDTRDVPRITAMLYSRLMKDYLGDEPERTKGMHLSGVLRYIAITTGLLKIAQAIAEEELPLRMALGFAWEEFASTLYPHLIYQPGEITEAGVIMTCDGHSILDDRFAIEEFKCTWKKVRTGNELIREEWYWGHQGRGYCWGYDARFVRWHILYINGHYRGGGPVYMRYLVEFSDREVESTRNMVLKNAARAAEKGYMEC